MKMLHTLLQPSRLSAKQGAIEKRSEAYMQYVERVSQIATQYGAKSISGVSGSADEQTNATRRL